MMNKMIVANLVHRPIRSLISIIAIAQDVQTVLPQAVARGRDGYLRVFYDKLGVTFQTYAHWMASGARVPAGITR